MSDRSLYEVLGVSETASLDEIKSAYRRLLRTVHPDVGGNAALFGFVQSAYETLSDHDRRANYDRQRRGASQPTDPPPPPRTAPPPPREPESSGRGAKIAGLTGIALAVIIGIGVVIASANQGAELKTVPTGSEEAPPAQVEPEPDAEPVEPEPVDPEPVEPEPVEPEPVEPAPQGADPGDVVIGQLRAEYACTTALSRLPLDLNDPGLEPALRAAAESALSASLKDPTWNELREVTRTALGAYVATGAEGNQDDAVDEFADAMFRIDEICQASSF